MNRSPLVYEAGDMLSFGERFPKRAVREIRVLTVAEGHAQLPEGRYAFNEMFCEAPSCDCRRARIVVHRLDGEFQALATIGYGWESLQFYEAWSGNADHARWLAGIGLEPMAPQSRFAEVFLVLFERFMEDQQYARRIQRHYLLMKGASTRRLRAAAKRRKRR